MPRSSLDPMSAPVPSPVGLRRRGRRRRPPRRADRPMGRTYPLKWVVVALVLTAAVLIGGPYVYFDLIEGSAPARLHLPPAAGVTPSQVAPGPVSGTWVVSTGSVAGYRVNELLFGQTHAAVGRTSQVSGGIVISGNDVTAADFSVHLASVKSDQGSRDAQFRGFIMDTADHPNATFRLTSPVHLDGIPAVGQQVTAQAVGDLTLRGVRRSVTFTLAAERVGTDSIDVNAEIPIRFSLWHIPNPSFAVAQLGSTGTIEVLLHLLPGKAKGKA